MKQGENIFNTLEAIRVEITRRHRLGRVALVACLSLGLVSVIVSSCNREEKENVHQNEDNVLAGEVDVEDSSDELDSIASIFGARTDDTQEYIPNVPLTVSSPREFDDDSLFDVEGNYNDQGNETILRSAERMPRFPAGEDSLMNYIKNHIRHPAMADKNNNQSKVILQFVVEKDGTVGEVKVARSVDKNLDDEAIRVVKSLPKFIPGRQNGKVVRVWYTLPVDFKLPQTRNHD